MSQRKIKKINGQPRKATELGSLEHLLKGVEKMKQLNSELVASIDEKLKDFNTKVNDLNQRLTVLEKGVTNDRDDVRGGPENSTGESGGQ